MSIGTVRSYDRLEGEGRIVPDDGGADVPVRTESIVSTNRRFLEAGQRVRFDVLMGHRCFQAENVRRV